MGKAEMEWGRDDLTWDLEEPEIEGYYFGPLSGENGWILFFKFM